MSHSQYNQGILQCVVAEICQAVGFDSVHSTTLDVLTDVLERYISNIATTTHDITEQCGHTHAHVNDVRQCFRLKNTSLQELIDYIQQMDEVKLSVTPKKYPFPKKSNFQFSSAHSTNDMEYVYPYFPSIAETTKSAVKGIETTSSKSAIAPAMSTIVGKGSDDEMMDQDPYSSDSSSAKLSGDETVDDGEPLWLKQQIKQSQKQKKEIPPGPGIAPSSVVHNPELLWSFETNPAPQLEPPQTMSWDTPKFSRPKLSGAGKSSSFAPKTEPSDSVTKTIKPVKSKSSITSRIEEVNRLLHDPIIEKNSKNLSESSSLTIAKPSINAPSSPSTSSKSQKNSHDRHHSELLINDSLTFASPKSMDDAIDAVVHRASKEAEEAELMKFSHLIKEFSSSDEDSDVAVSHKTEELLQLQKRGLQKPLEEESPERPPLTPSPAPSNQSIIIDEDVGLSPRNSYTSSPERMEISTNTISERTWSMDSPKSLFKPANFNFDKPPSETKLEQVKSKKKIKTLKKTKIKAKERAKHTSSEHVSSKDILSHKKEIKPVEKLILKKSKSGEAKVVKHKEKEVPVPVLMEHAPLPKLSPVPKLSASISLPPSPPPSKKKDKKEKKKKKEKEKEEKLSKKIKEDLSPIPKLTFKMASSSKNVSIVKPPKQKHRKSTDKSDKKPGRKKSTESKTPVKKDVKHVASIDVKRGVSIDVKRGITPDVKRGITTNVKRGSTPDVKRGGTADVKRGGTADVKRGGTADVKRGGTADVKRGGTADVKRGDSSDVKRGVTTETISVGIVYDDHGNRIWICPGCNKPDDGSPMIGCDGCDGWYHWPCVGITSEPTNDEWYCPNCAK